MPRSPRASFHDAASTARGTLTIITVTKRPAVRLRIAAVSAQLALAPPRCGDRLDEVLALDGSDALLVIDLGSDVLGVEPATRIREWTRRSPGGEVVLFTPLLDREAELRTALELLRALRDVDPLVLTATDFYGDETWPLLAARRERAALERALCADFLDAVSRIGGSLRAREAVLALLAGAPRGGASWSAPAPADPGAREAGERRLRERARKERWKLLRGAGHLPASSLELVFRVLWFARLRHDGWSTAHIADFLRFSSAAELRRALRRRLGVGVRTLHRIAYQDALHWAAAAITAPRHPECRPAARALGHALARCARGGSAADDGGERPTAAQDMEISPSAAASSRTPRLISRASTAANPS